MHEISKELPEHFRTDIFAFDLHHMWFLILFWHLHQVLLKNKTKGCVDRIFRICKEYLIVHCNAEEQVMFLLNYPKAEEHKKSHEFFIELVNVLIDKNNNKTIVPDDIVRFYHKLLNHIDTVDRDYSDFYHKNELLSAPSHIFKQHKIPLIPKLTK